MEEEWRSYKTQRTNIEVSNMGNIRGIKWNNKKFDDSLIIVNDDGRRCIAPGRCVIYQLVWKLFNGPVPKGYVIHHKDHNKLNDCLDNLQLMTTAEHCMHHHIGKVGYWKDKFHSDETKKKMSESHKGEKSSFYGKKFSDEHRRNLSEALKGRKLSNETKQKMSVSRKGRIFSEETKRKISEARKKYFLNRKTK